MGKATSGIFCTYNVVSISKAISGVCKKSDFYIYFHSAVPFITFCLGSIGMDSIISESCYKLRYTFTKELLVNDHGNFLPIIPL